MTYSPSDAMSLSIPQLRGQVNGRVIAPGDADYDEARTVFYGGIDRRPAIIVRPADTADVAHIVALARDSGLELAVRSGGHSLAGHSASEGGIVLDLSDLRAIDIDIERRTAWAWAGLTAGEYSVAAAAHGLGTGFGDMGSVGIGGITLGGGVGLLVRKYGLTIDDLLAADVVTADGELVRADANSHPDLFWAIRGGGGNFGVVTRFQFRLHPVATIVGGTLVLPATPDVITAFVTEAENAPEELSAIANVMVAPPLPFVPEEVHGRLVVMATLAYAGPTEDGEPVVARFRALAPPIVDMVRPMSYPEIYPPAEEGFHPIASGHNGFVDTIDRAAADTIVEHLQTSTAFMAAAQLRVLGGAAARVPDDATAYAHRGRRIMVNLGAMYQDPTQRATHEAWIATFSAALPQPDHAAYVNFLGDADEARVRDAYPGATWDRLRKIKRRYDPTNVFHANHNIPPA